MSKKPWESVTFWGVVLYAIAQLTGMWEVDMTSVENLQVLLTDKLDKIAILTGEVAAALGIRRAVGTNTVISLK